MVTLRRPSFSRAVFTGSAAATAYLLAQAVDRHVVPSGYDDLVLWGGFLSRRRGRQRLLGAGAHYSLGIALAAAYDAALPSLPAIPGPLLGILFTQVENAVLYPGVPILNAIHPEVRSGSLPSLWTWQFFWLEAWRHLAYGAVLGALTPAGRLVRERPI